MFIPREIVLYGFKKKNEWFMLLLSFLQGWVLVKYLFIGLMVDRYKISLFRSIGLLNARLSLFFNIVFGLYKNYKHHIKFKGVGFKGAVIGDRIVLKIGFSHRVLFIRVSGLKILYKQRQEFILISRDYFVLKNIVYIFKNIRKINSYKKKCLFTKGSLYRLKLSSKKSKF